VWGWTSLRTSHDMLHSLILSWLSLLCFTFMPCSLCESHSKKMLYNDNKKHASLFPFSY
jgi:hypothetical protein